MRSRQRTARTTAVGFYKTLYALVLQSLNPNLSRPSFFSRLALTDPPPPFSFDSKGKPLSSSAIDSDLRHCLLIILKMDYCVPMIRLVRNRAKSPAPLSSSSSFSRLSLASPPVHRSSTPHSSMSQHERRRLTEMTRIGRCQS